MAANTERQDRDDAWPQDRPCGRVSQYGRHSIPASCASPPQVPE